VECIPVDKVDTLLALCVLLGDEDVDWWPQETDQGWWQLRLWLMRN